MASVREVPLVSVKVLQPTWARLNARKVHPGDTMEDVVRRLLDATERTAETGEAPKG